MNISVSFLIDEMKMKVLFKFGIACKNVIKFGIFPEIFSFLLKLIRNRQHIFPFLRLVNNQILVSVEFFASNKVKLVLLKNANCLHIF